MESAQPTVPSFFTPLVFRVSFIVSIVIITIGFLITHTALTAHSESDVKYRQESVFLGAGLAASKREIINPPQAPDENKIIAMSFEIDKVTPTPTPQVDASGDEIWYKIADCESHRNWKSDTGNGYYGGLQFSLGAWASVGGNGKPSDASAEEQISKGKLLQSRRGWGPWGGCSKKLGLI